MFGAFRVNASNKDNEFVDLSTVSGVDARGYTLVACDSCRSRKLKCNGDRVCCERCEATSGACTYTTNSSNGSAQKRSRRSPNYLLGDAARQNLAHSRPNVDAGNSETSSATFQSQDGHRTQEHSTSSTVSSSMLTPTITPGVQSIWSSISNNFDDFLLEPPEDSETSPGALFDRFDRAMLAAELNAGENTCTQNTAQLPSQFAQKRHVSSATTRFPVPLAQRGDDSIQLDKMETDYAQAPNPMAGLLLADSDKQFPSATGQYVQCRCLNVMAHLLEQYGVQVPEVETGLDTRLMSLRSAVDKCDQVLACKQCTASSDNSMLLALVAQQLGTISHNIGQSAVDHDQGTEECDTASGMAGFPYQDMLQPWTISFGRYIVQMHEMRLSLIHHIIVLHLTDVHSLMNRVLDRMKDKRVASGLVTDAEKKTARAIRILLAFRK
ncbi:putative Zn(2)-C6 fungal-type domain-containing protein [Seiridium cardinale]|uniref:Zn(2)-C6 fungal-type domain-containing protein n=1 Tax=Seiridium cardinale TaxID=138064 RepID=A0ABR2XMH8_9PEZI